MKSTTISMAVLVVALLVATVDAGCETTGCSGYGGVCRPETSECACHEGRNGTQCEDYTCVGRNNETCSNSGMCIHGKICACRRGFAGVLCDECAKGYIRVYHERPGCWPSQCVSPFPDEAHATTTLALCGDHGTCNWNGECACATGYTGPRCWRCTNGYIRTATGECR
jgi:hypothetical protein